METLGEDAGELRNFRFTSEDLRDLRLLLVPVSTEGSYPKGFPLCSPEGELASSAAWCVYRNTYDTDNGCRSGLHSDAVCKDTVDDSKKDEQC